jgi:hypothetical protein
MDNRQGYTTASFVVWLFERGVNFLRPVVIWVPAGQEVALHLMPDQHAARILDDAPAGASGGSVAPHRAAGAVTRFRAGQGVEAAF